MPNDEDEEQKIRIEMQRLREKYSDIACQAEETISRAMLESEKIDLKAKSEIRKTRMK